METFLYYAFWLIINLDLLAIGALILGCLFFIFSKKKAALNLFFIAAAPIIVINVTPLGPWMIMELENRFPRPETLPADVDGIILLGGSFSLAETKERGEPVFNMVGTRIYQFMELARKLPQAKLITTGNTLESEWTEKMLLDTGFARDRLIIDSDARRTEDHATFVKKLVEPLWGDKGKYLLVTSAFHMPRAVGVFRESGLNIIPYCVDYHAPGKMSTLFWLSSVLQRLTPMSFKQAVIEWAGLVTYYAKGISDELYPKP